MRGRKLNNKIGITPFIKKMRTQKICIALLTTRTPTYYNLKTPHPLKVF